MPALAFHAFRTAWEGLGRRGLASLGWLGVAVPETFERSRPHSRTALCRREAPPRPTRSGFPPSLRLVSEHAVASRMWERSRPPRYLTSHRLIPPNPLFSVGRAGSCPFLPLAWQREQVTQNSPARATIAGAPDWAAGPEAPRVTVRMRRSSWAWGRPSPSAALARPSLHACLSRSPLLPRTAVGVGATPVTSLHPRHLLNDLISTFSRFRRPWGLGL